VSDFSVTPRVRQTLLICLIVALATLYVVAWFAPAIGLAYYEGEALLAAKSGAFASTSSPPLFPALLGLFTLVSQNAQWLKALPLLCTILWLVLTRRLLVKMGASAECALMLVVMTAASPTVLYLATGSFPEPLLAVLAVMSLLALLEEKPLVAGLCAGLATITLTKGAPLILAGIITLTVNRRLRSAAWFTGGAMALASPWLGWRLAHGVGSGAALAASDRAILFGRNAVLLAASPFTLLSGYPSLYPGLLTAAALLIVVIRRRHFVPDLFVGLYCIPLLFRPQPPLHAFAAVLPLFVWMLWRVARIGRFASATKAAAILMLCSALWFCAMRVRTVPTLGAVAPEDGAPDNWHEMEKLFGFIRDNTPKDSVVMANLSPMFEINTGRRSIRGFADEALITPDQLRSSALREHVGFVVVTPEQPSFRRAAEALERGGVVEPVAVPGETAGYRLLKVVR
jgi:hypothetical protein